MKNTVFAYIAGYTDGDGCFYLGKTYPKERKNPKYRATFVLTSTNPHIIMFFIATFGGSCRIFDKKINTKHKPAYHFILGPQDCKKFVKNVSPFLVEKQKEAEILIQFIESIDRQEKEVLIFKMNKFKEEINLVYREQKQIFESFRSTIKPTQEDFSYLAGLIDAECCLGLYKYRTKEKPNFIYKILLQCNNTKAPIFKWLLERFGGQIHFIDRSAKSQRNQFTWRLSSKSLGDLLPYILPHLKYKKPVCEELIKFYKTTVPLEGNISRNSPNFLEFYQSILDERECIFHKIQSLNKKGV